MCVCVCLLLLYSVYIGEKDIQPKDLDSEFYWCRIVEQDNRVEKNSNSFFNCFYWIKKFFSVEFCSVFEFFFHFKIQFFFSNTGSAIFYFFLSSSPSSYRISNSSRKKRQRIFSFINPSHWNSTKKNLLLKIVDFFLEKKE